MDDKIAKINDSIVLESEDNITEDEVLANAMGELKEVIIIGVDYDGNEVSFSTPTTRADVYFRCHEFAATLLERDRE